MFQLATKMRPSVDALRTAQQAQYQAVEFWTNISVFEQRKKMAAMAKEFSFHYVIHFPNRGSLSTDLLQEVASLYRQLDCRAMVVHEPMYQRYGDELMAINPSLRLGIENHELSRDEFYAWAETSPWLTLDIEHLWKYTLCNGPLSMLQDTLCDFLSRFADKLIHVHLPGYLPKQEEHRPMYCSREMVMSALTMLAEVRFDGFVVSEINARYQHLCDLKMDALLVQRWREMRVDPVAEVGAGNEVEFRSSMR